VLVSSARAAEVIEIGNLRFDAPAKFERQRPRSEIIAHEFTVPAAKGDDQGGRMTVMEAGGTVDQNIERWYAQFTQPDGSPTKDVARLEEKKLGGRLVHFVDISGTYDDKPAPFAPGVKRDNYRMLGAIIETARGNIYFKFYGPQKTLAEHAEQFRTMIVKGLDKS
jgi:hypothetical protein